MSKLADHIRSRLRAWREANEARLDILSRIARAEARRDAEAERRKTFHAYPFRELGKQLLIQRHRALLDLDWETRWSIWEGQDGSWYGSVRELHGYTLHGPYSTHTSAVQLTEYADQETRRAAASELNKLENWRDYYGQA